MEALALYFWQYELVGSGRRGAGHTKQGFLLVGMPATPGRETGGDWKTMRGGTPLPVWRVSEAGAGRRTCGPALTGFPHLLVGAGASQDSFFRGKKEACLGRRGYPGSGQVSEGVEGPLWGSWAGSVGGAEPSTISSAWT